LRVRRVETLWASAAMRSAYLKGSWCDQGGEEEDYDRWTARWSTGVRGGDQTVTGCEGKKFSSRDDASI